MIKIQHQHLVKLATHEMNYSTDVARNNPEMYINSSLNNITISQLVKSANLLGVRLLLKKYYLRFYSCFNDLLYKSCGGANDVSKANDTWLHMW